MARKRKQNRDVRLAANVTPELRDRLVMEQMNMERRTGARPSFSSVIAAVLEKGLAIRWQ